MPYSKQLHILLYYNSEEGKKGRELPRTIEGDQTLIYTRTWVVEILHHQALPGPFPMRRRVCRHLSQLFSISNSEYTHTKSRWL